MSNGIPQFQKHIDWGNHHLPVDQATSFSVHETQMGPDASSPTRYSVIIEQNTIRDVNPFGIASYHIKSFSASKVDAVVKRLLEHNVKWTLPISSIKTSAQDRTIDVVLSPSLLLQNNKIGLLASSLARAINIPLRAGSCQFIENVTAPFIRYTLKSGVNVAQTMEQILRGWDRTSSDHQVRRLLSQSHSEIQLNDEDDHKQFANPTAFDLSLDSDDMPTASSAYLAPVFSLDDKGNMVSYNRYFPNGPSSWSEEDLPYLLTQHRHAPTRADLNEDEQPAAPAPVQVVEFLPPRLPVQSDADLEADLRLALELHNEETSQYGRAAAQEEIDREAALALQNPAAPPPARQAGVPPAAAPRVPARDLDYPRSRTRENDVWSISLNDRAPS
jgi:hypothetical protein